MATLPYAVIFPEDVLFQVIDDEALVLNLRDETVFSLNGTGARIAQLVADGQRPDAIVEVLCAEYEIERPTMEQEVADLLRLLLSRGLLVPAPGAPQEPDRGR